MIGGVLSLFRTEWADDAAGAAAVLDKTDTYCMYSSIRSLCRRREIVEFEHERCRQVYGKGHGWI